MTDVSESDDSRATVSGPRFTDRLRARAEPAPTNAVDHRSARALGSGTLAGAVDADSLVKDYAVSVALVSFVGHAVARASDVEARRPLVGCLDTSTDGANDYVERAIGALGVDDARVDETAAFATTAGFVDLLARAARESGSAETLAALVPAEWLYAGLARRDSPATEPSPGLPFHYADWIATHANPSVEAFGAWLLGRLDAHGARVAAARQPEIERRFRRTVDLEAACVDAADAAGGAPEAGGD